MNTQVEKLENSQVSLTVEVGAEKVGEAITKAYNEMKKDFNVAGFRKGKVPRAMIEKMYGVEVFFNKAADFIIDETLGLAIDENKVDIAARIRPQDLEVTEMTKEGMKYIATITTKPEVVLGDYKDLTVEVAKTEVTEEEINTEIQKEASKNAREVTVTDRAVEPQDTVTIDFEGFVDGVAFEGGKGEDHDLVIGSKSFIDNFEDQLIGKNVGEEVEVNVTFPEGYQAKELAGKPALFKVTIKEIKVNELPEINDDFAADVSEFETLDEYKKDIKARLEKQKEESYKAEVENKALEQAAINAPFTVPEAMVEDQADNNVRDFANRMRSQGLELEQYLEFTGQNMDAFKENFKEDAKKQLRTRLVLEKIAEVENIEVTEEEVEAELAKIAEAYKMEIEKLKESFGPAQQEMLKGDVKLQKAVKIITDSAKVVEK
jgi:trigger factor